MYTLYKEIKLKHLCFVLCLPLSTSKKTTNIKIKKTQMHFHHSLCICLYVCFTLHNSTKQKIPLNNARYQFNLFFF